MVASVQAKRAASPDPSKIFLKLPEHPTLELVGAAVGGPLETVREVTHLACVIDLVNHLDSDASIADLDLDRAGRLVAPDPGGRLVAELGGCAIPAAGQLTDALEGLAQVAIKIGFPNLAFLDANRDAAASIAFRFVQPGEIDIGLGQLLRHRRKQLGEIGADGGLAFLFADRCGGLALAWRG